MRYARFVLASMALAMAVVSGANADPPAPHLSRGAPAPDFTVDRLMGGTLQLSALAMLLPPFRGAAFWSLIPE